MNLFLPPELVHVNTLLELDPSLIDVLPSHLQGLFSLFSSICYQAMELTSTGAQGGYQRKPPIL